MRSVCCGFAAALLLAGALPAGDCEVLYRYDFDDEKEHPKGFSNGGEYPHPENKAEGHSLVLSDELDFEGKEGGKCMVLHAGGPGGDPWYGGRDLWFVRDPIPTKGLRLSVCFYTEDAKGIQPVCPVKDAGDNCYNLTVTVRHQGKAAGVWMADPDQFLEDRKWGAVTWDILNNRFNATHVPINPDMHSLVGIRLHPGGWGDDESVTVALDNFVLYRGRDTTPPASVKGVTATASKGVVTLRWARPPDNLFAVRYEVFRSASPDAPADPDHLIASVHTVDFSDGTLVNPGDYYYRVAAYDYAGNASEPSGVARVSLGDDGEEN